MWDRPIQKIKGEMSYVLPLEVDCCIDFAVGRSLCTMPPLEELDDGDGTWCLSISLPCDDDFLKGMRAVPGFKLLVFPGNDGR